MRRDKAESRQGRFTAGGRHARCEGRPLMLDAGWPDRTWQPTLTRVIATAFVGAALFAAPDARAETACEKALNSPPLSEVHDYIAGKKDGQYAGGTFANLFNSVLRDKSCKKHEIIVYIEEFSAKKEEYYHNKYNVIVYRYKSPYQSYFWYYINIIINYDRPILLRFDLDGNFITSSWSI